VRGRGDRDVLAIAPASRLAARRSVARRPAVRRAALRRGLLLCLGVGSFVLAVPAAAQTCPGTGDCCTANPTPGCADAACCDQVCLIDGFCCLSSWDANCASLALTICGAEACSGSVCPGPGDCCADNGTPACDDFDCCELVCAQDGFCCSTSWDQNCADLALNVCNASSCSGVTCAGIGDCCSENGSPSCEDESCCAQVCAQDAFCCDTLWDGQCVALAEGLCAAICSEPSVPAVTTPGRRLLVSVLLVAGSAILLAHRRLGGRGRRE
jgi:hypothetical protein